MKPSKCPLSRRSPMGLMPRFLVGSETPRVADRPFLMGTGSRMTGMDAWGGAGGEYPGRWKAPDRLRRLNTPVPRSLGIVALTLGGLGEPPPPPGPKPLKPSAPLCAHDALLAWPPNMDDAPGAGGLSSFSSIADSEGVLLPKGNPLAAAAAAATFPLMGLVAAPRK